MNPKIEFRQHLSDLEAVLPTLKKTQKLLNTQPWPPQPNFELPEIFQVWIYLANNTTQKLHLASNPYEYREWVNRQLSLDTNLLEKSLVALEELVATSSYEDLAFHPILCGLLATITYLGHAFRWGTMPITLEAKKESYLDFPAPMIAIWQRLHEYLKISGNGGCAFSVNLLNCYRENAASPHFNATDETLILPNCTRWLFNQDSEYQKTEAQFNLVFARMEAYGKHAYLKMIDCAELMSNISTKGVTSETIFQLNLILNQIADHAQLSFDIFFKMREVDVNSAIWVDAVELPHGWRINDGDSGVSGTQNLIINALDAFFQIQGSSLMYTTLRKARSRMPQFMREFCIAMDIVGYALTAVVSNYSDLHQAYNRGIDILLKFRRSHRAKGSKYLAGRKNTKSSAHTSSGLLESIISKNKDSSTLKSTFLNEMDNRIIETQESHIKPPRDLPFQGG